MRNLLSNFRNFAFSGSLIDLAVGLAIGAAFAAVVESLVGDVILPLVAAIFGAPNFDALVLTVNGSHIRYGAFLTAFVAFLLLAFVIMLIVQAIRRATGREAAGAQGSRECDHCKSSFRWTPRSACSAPATSNRSSPEPLARLGAVGGSRGLG